ncbi:MAG: hypothetical protein HZC28_08630 [Spirochaetes bacterium]|nr:hypothetical protein [Spirochaetota bacterium]
MKSNLTPAPGYSRRYSMKSLLTIRSTMVPSSVEVTFAVRANNEDVSVVLMNKKYRK